MQEDFHYYATYCAAYIAGFSHDESLNIAYSAQLVDNLSQTFLTKIKAPVHAATTQLALEMMNHRTDTIGIQNITRIWASFHFLPKDLYSECKPKSRRYRSRYHLICGPNGTLVKDTVELAKDESLQATGIAMHVLADTWAHMNFAGTPSLVINDVNPEAYEILDDGSKIPISFNHKVSGDNMEKSKYLNSVFQPYEISIMNLGHGRAGHLPDYSYIHYQYMPAWADYEMFDKNNPEDYYHAFCQMVYAMQYLRGKTDEFELNKYAFDTVEPYKDRINAILRKRQLIANDDWKEFGQELSGKEIEDFNLEKYQDEYQNADENEKDSTFLGKYIIAALSQKSMVTNRIYKSGNLVAGYSVDVTGGRFRGIKDYIKILGSMKRSDEQ